MLNPEVFRQAIRAGGETIRWWRAVPCSCYNPEYNKFDRSCTKCEFGHIYTEQTLAADVRALVSREKRKYPHTEEGLIKAGDLNIQVWPAEILLTPMDKVVLLQRPKPHSERVARGEDTLSRPYPSALVDVRDSGTEYTIGTDCTLDTTTRVITWTDGAGPDDGDTYTVTYKYFPIYWFVFGDETPTRPIPGYGAEQTPQQGYLVEKHPGGG